MNAQVETPVAEIALQTGAVIDVALNRLKTSPRNARRAPHGEAALEALAASIAVKGVLQAPVVEPELDADGAPTGCYLVTIGEGRRLALCLLAKRKVIRKTALVRVVVDLTNDPQEVSLDENVTRTAMHPADQFEAFRDLSERKGWGAEEIAARFGVSAHVVRQRLRLGAVAPKLMALYREEGLTLDQLMAFAVTEDHARQEQVFDLIGAERPPYAIRRAMTETKVSAQDRRAVFIGAAAYGAAGGTILRDLFTEDGGGWFEDASLLDRLVSERLNAEAEAIRKQEGWKWAEAHIDYPRALGLSRTYPREVERSAEDAAAMAALSDEYDAVVSQHDGAEAWPPEVEARLAEIEAALAAFGDSHVYHPEDIASGGLFVILGHDGVARVERGLIRDEDRPAPEPEPADEDHEVGGEGDEPVVDGDEAGADGKAPLSERLVLDLTAQRTMALRDALAGDATVALTAITHLLALAAFYAPYERPTCLEIKPTSQDLGGQAPGIEDTVAGRNVAARHAVWAGRVPREADDLWDFVQQLGAGELMALMAHCASLTVNAVRTGWDRPTGVFGHADRMAQALSLDMGAYWTPTADTYFGRVAKARIADAVREAVSADAAARIGGLKKPEMAAEAERLIAGTGWLPAVLRPVARAPEDLETVTPMSQEAA